MISKDAGPAVLPHCKSFPVLAASRWSSCLGFPAKRSLLGIVLAGCLQAF